MCLSNYSSNYSSIYLSICLSIYLFCRKPLDIGTLKSDPKRMCFVHVDLQTRFSLQRRAIFPHPNFRKWSKALMFLTFWLSNVLRATATCHFSTSALPKMCSETLMFLAFWVEKMLGATAACHFWTAELQKVVRRRFVLCMLIWKCASRYRGVPFLHRWTSKSGPRMVCFAHFHFAQQRRAIFHFSSGHMAPHPPL